MATLLLDGDAHKLRLPTSFNVNDRLGVFHARADYRYQCLVVIAKEITPGNWTVTPYPGIAQSIAGGDGAVDGVNNINTADFVWYCGEHEISDGNLVSALQAAGYTVDTGG